MHALAEPPGIVRTSGGSTVPGLAGPRPAQAVAIMQPYLFPYLGYFALAAAADAFVFYDDVHYIPRGWINRNRILIHGAAHTFTVPVAGASQNRLIHEIETHDFAGWRERFLRQLHAAYRRSAHFASGLALVEQVLDVESPTIAGLAMRSVERVAQRLGIGTTFMRSSQRFADSRGTPRATRLIGIAQALGARRYLNAPGGAALYTREEFSAAGLALQFVQPELRPYPQAACAGFVPGLSVIDALMQASTAEVAALARRCRLD